MNDVRAAKLDRLQLIRKKHGERYLQGMAMKNRAMREYVAQRG